MKQGLQRQLVAVMFTDMVDYTALFQADELVAVDKRERYVRAVEQHHQSLGGTIVQRRGDGTMSMFPSAHGGGAGGGARRRRNPARARRARHPGAHRRARRRSDRRA